MTSAEQRTAAKAFTKEWQGRGYEKGESQVFWLTLLRDVFGVEKPEEMISFGFYLSFVIGIYFSFFTCMCTFVLPFDV